MLALVDGLLSVQAIRAIHYPCFERLAHRRPVTLGSRSFRSYCYHSSSLSVVLHFLCNTSHVHSDIPSWSMAPTCKVSRSIVVQDLNDTDGV